MNTAAKWGIGLGAGIPGVLILIGLIGLLVKFFMKRCRKKAWNDIKTLPKQLHSSENNGKDYLKVKRTVSERQPLCPSATNNALDRSDEHIRIPIDENDQPPSQRANEATNSRDHTLVQIQRDRLTRLKEEENRLRPMLRLAVDEHEVQSAIDQAQKEFDESV